MQLLSSVYWMPVVLLQGNLVGTSHSPWLVHRLTAHAFVACENGCYESTSETAISGIVENPWAIGYSAGGSSSGSASLVASGAVDMSIGCDQGG